MIFGPDGFNLKALTSEEIRYGVVLRLPFRIRVDGLVHVPPIDDKAHVWIRNSVSIPMGSHLPAILHALPGKERDGYQALFSEALVLLTAPVLQPGALEAIKGGNISSLGSSGNIFQALSVLNEVVFGYSEIGFQFGIETSSRAGHCAEFSCACRLRRKLM